MHRSLWSDIAKRQAKVVFVNNIRRYFAVDDFQKDCQQRFPVLTIPTGLTRIVTVIVALIVSVDGFSCN